MARECERAGGKGAPILHVFVSYSLKCPILKRLGTRQVTAVLLITTAVLCSSTEGTLVDAVQK